MVIETAAEPLPARAGRPRRAGAAVLLVLAVALLGAVLLAAGWLHRLDWFGPRGVPAAEWAAIAGQSRAVLAVALLACAASAACFVLAGAREGFAASCGWVAVGLVLVAVVAVVCVGSGSDAIRLADAWAASAR